MWMNEGQIDHAVDVLKNRAPDVAKYAQFLSDWRDTVNDNSDGWSSWKTGASCAEKLSDLVQRAVGVALDRGGRMPSEAEWKKALSPIRAAATKFKLKAPTLGGEPAPTAERGADALPYVFDLYWDLKTRGALATHYGRLRREVAEIERAMKEAGIELSADEMKADEPAAPAPRG